MVFAFAGANALAATGLPKQMTTLLNQMNLPLWLLAILIGLIVIAVAAPLSATATMAAVGTVGVATLVAAGVPATTAAVAVLVFSSCEAAVPPGARRCTWPAASPTSIPSKPSPACSPTTPCRCWASAC